MVLTFTSIFLLAKACGRFTRGSFFQIGVQNRCLQNFFKFHRKAPVLESLFTKGAGLTICNFIKKRLQYRCFPMKFDFEKFLRTPFFTGDLRLLLFCGICITKHVSFIKSVFRMILLISRFCLGIIQLVRTQNLPKNQHFLSPPVIQIQHGRVRG